MANHTILLIDYEPRSIERFRQPLTAAGYRVEIATDGIAGVEAFGRLNPDMVLVEAMIPKKHGFEVCQELKRTPHGRRTPIIITTGVYKGRKYRTQALHIYGCDEYIEKPIAAEQLLAIVDRFLAGSTPAAREPVAAAVEASEVASAMAADAPRSAPESTPRPTGHKPGPIPKAVVGDLTEDEIMARLDAILPGSAPDASSLIVESVESPESVPETVPLEIATDTEPSAEPDPFLQMQAELTAELGSLNTALALEPSPLLEPVSDPIPSDQVATPPLLESLPAPEPPAPPAPATIPLDVPPAISPGQVVSFDAKRSRKHKKSGRKQGSSTASAPPGAPLDSPTLTRSEAPRSSKEIGIPSGTLVESALSTSTPSRGIPAWAWILVGAIALVVVYFVFWSGRPLPGRTAIESTPDAHVAEESMPPESGGDPASSAPKTPPSPDSHLVLNAVGPQPARAAPAPEPAPVEAPRKKAAELPAESPKPTAVTKLAATKPAATPPLAAPAGLSSADAGVEAIVAPVEAEAPRPTTARGSLVDISEVDSPPASLARKLPAYSMQARQMRIQGTVVLKVLVNELGTVDQVVVQSGIDGAGLNDATVRAARQWTYRPAMKDGVPVKVWTVERVTFKI